MKILVYLLFVAITISACSSVSKNQEKFIGEWLYAGSTDSYLTRLGENQLINSKDREKLVLNNGDWSLGETSGEWGDKDEIRGVNFLNFREWEISSEYSIKEIDAQVEEINGVETIVLELTISSSGTGVSTVAGENYVVEKNYSDVFKYYYVKTPLEKKAIKKYLEEKPLMDIVEEVNKQLKNIAPSEISIEGNSLYYISLSDGEDGSIGREFLEKYKKALKLGIKKGNNVKKLQEVLMLLSDDDKDGISNEIEKKFGMNPKNRDSDGDGIDDSSEFNGIYDEFSFQEIFKTGFKANDSDGDGLIDALDID
jgi:hypothetical protein